MEYSHYIIKGVILEFYARSGIDSWPTFAKFMYSFTDNLFYITNSMGPVLSYYLFGLMFGIFSGIIIGLVKLKASRKIITLVIAGVSICILLFTMIKGVQAWTKAHLELVEVDVIEKIKSIRSNATNENPVSNLQPDNMRLADSSHFSKVKVLEKPIGNVPENTRKGVGADESEQRTPQQSEKEPKDSKQHDNVNSKGNKTVSPTPQNHRATTYASLLKKGHSRFNRGEYGTAKLLFQDASKLYPEKVEPINMLQEIKAILEYEQKIKTSKELLSNRNFLAAHKHAITAKMLIPTKPQADALLLEIETKLVASLNLQFQDIMQSKNLKEETSNKISQLFKSAESRNIILVRKGLGSNEGDYDDIRSFLKDLKLGNYFYIDITEIILDHKLGKINSMTIVYK